MTSAENAGDLISREALKKEVALMFGDKTHITESVCDLIDNAPTVNLEKTSFMKGYNYGCDDGKRFYGRPQGEWELHGMIYYCSNCGHYCGESGDNFCGNCGADMRKGGAV